MPYLRLIRTNLLRVFLVTWGAFAAVAGLDWALRQGWAGAAGIAGVTAGYYGTLAAVTMVPGAVVHWLGLMAASRRVPDRTLRVAAVALSPVLGIAMYLGFRTGADRDTLLPIALGISVIYGLVVRLPPAQREKKVAP